MGKNAKLKEKQKWFDEKFHLENERKLRGIYFVDPEDTEFKETVKNARTKLETTVVPVVPCKINRNCGEAVIKMIINGRSPTMRHVSRTHRVVLDWLFDRINLDSKIQIKYIDTIKQLADILTKGNFTRDEWNHLLNLLNISHFSSTARTVAMAKRAQQESGEERTAKIKAYDEFNIENAFDCVRLQLHQTWGGPRMVDD